MTLRTFIAVRIPAGPSLRKVIAAFDRMGKAVRAAHPDQLHVTLKFLGDVSAERAAEIAAAMDAAVGSEPAFTVQVASLGTFPHLERPSVVWAGLRKAAPLAAMAGRLDAKFEELGFARETRAFTPHVTLARVKFRPPADLAELVRRETETAFGPASIEAVELFRSDPGREGPVYTPLASTRLISP